MTSDSVTTCPEAPGSPPLHRRGRAADLAPRSRPTPISRFYCSLGISLLAIPALIGVAASPRTGEAVLDRNGEPADLQWAALHVRPVAAEDFAPRVRPEGRITLTVPREAVMFEGGDAHVWVADPSSRTLALRDIVVGPVVHGHVQVLSGLKPEQSVVTNGAPLSEPPFSGS